MKRYRNKKEALINLSSEYSMNLCICEVSETNSIDEKLNLLEYVSAYRKCSSPFSKHSSFVWTFRDEIPFFFK